jgi:hypothetical protein
MFRAQTGGRLVGVDRCEPLSRGQWMPGYPLDRRHALHAWTFVSRALKHGPPERDIGDQFLE